MFLSKMFRYFLLIIIFSLFFGSSAYAQTPIPVTIQASNSSPCNPVQQFLDDIKEKAGNLFNFERQTKMLTGYTQSNLPSYIPQDFNCGGTADTSSSTKSVQGTSTDVGIQAVEHYGLGAAIKTPNPVSTDFASFLEQIKYNILGFGNKSAENVVRSCGVPVEIADKSNTMDKAFGTCQCAYLPGGCDSSYQPQWLDK